MMMGQRDCLYREATPTRTPRILSPNHYPQALGTRGTPYHPSQQPGMPLPPPPLTYTTAHHCTPLTAASPSSGWVGMNPWERASIY